MVRNSLGLTSPLLVAWSSAAHSFSGKSPLRAAFVRTATANAGRCSANPTKGRCSTKVSKSRPNASRDAARMRPMGKFFSGAGSVSVGMPRTRPT